MSRATRQAIRVFTDFALGAEYDGRAGIGISFQDAQGEFLAFSAPVEIWPEMYCFERTKLIDAGEYLAIIVALELCHDLGFTHAVVHCDNTGVVREIGGLEWLSGSRTWSLGCLVRQLLCTAGSTVCVVPIARTDNQRADGLARHARKLHCEAATWKGRGRGRRWCRPWQRYVSGKYDLPVETRG